ncbi:MAG: hypothetical protein WDO18_15400 [Acidobacteriota bacterium]
MQKQDPLEDYSSNELGGLWLAYREACPDPESGVDFMPRLWQKIEARRMESLSIFKRLAQVCVAATAVMLVLLSTLQTQAAPDTDVLDSSSYTDLLAADQAKEAYSIIHPADLPGSQN